MIPHAVPPLSADDSVATNTALTNNAFTNLVAAPSAAEDHCSRSSLIANLETAFWFAWPLLLLVAWVNGPVVSPDQWWVRSSVVVMAVAGAIGLRVCRLRVRRRNQHADLPTSQIQSSDDATRSDNAADKMPRMVIGFLVLHSLLVGWCAYRNSFSWTETGLLPAGIIDWRYASFDVFRVNPPLVRMWATLPVLMLEPEIPFRGVSTNPRNRAEWDVARSMIDTNGEITWMWLTVARLWCLPFLWAGMWTAWRWSSRLFGRSAGIGCLLIWTFSPLMIGYGCLISGDAQAACMGLVTLYVFREWIRGVSLESSYILGVVAALTVLTKTSWMALFGLLPMLWLSIRLVEWLLSLHQRNRPGVNWKAVVRETALAIGSMGVCLLVINLAYGFDGSFRRLDSFEFISRALTQDENWKTHGYEGNRFRETWLGALPVPLPDDLVIGIDLQKWDFDRPRDSYFRGEWREHGWWYYYLYALGIKGPLGVWLLLLLAVAGAVQWSSCRGDWRDNLILLLPVMLVLGAASAETGLNRHVRYVLPIIPMVFVLISRICNVLENNAGWLRHAIVFCLSWLVVSSLWIYPHSHSYFNELIGGPLNAAWHMNASNLDWGQDLKQLRDWCERHQERRPVYTKSYLHLIDPARMGIPTSGTVPSMLFGVTSGALQDGNLRFPAGWYVVDNETILRDTGDYQYLNRLPIADHIGYGFRVYHITDQDSRMLQSWSLERAKRDQQ